MNTLIAQTERVACYGNAELSVQAHAALVRGAVDCPGELEPAWLGCGGVMVELYALPQTSRVPSVLLTARSPHGGEALFAVVHPGHGVDLSRGLDAPVTVTGHFDDPAAQSCHYTSWPDGSPPAAAEVIDGCRSTFVITQLELLDVGATADETPRPSPAGSPPLAPGTIAEVVTNDLVMRSGPAVSEASEIYPGRLSVGDRVYLVDGPVSADGYEWYLADPYQTDPDAEGWLRFGWVAAADRTGEAWIVAGEADCPGVASVETLSALRPSLRLYCFAAEPIVLSGDVACHDLGPPIPTAEPAWLTWAGCNLNPLGAPRYDPLRPGPSLGITIHYPPAMERKTGPLQVTAHLDDPVASSCRLPVPTLPGDVYSQELHDREQQLRCRASLVVDEVAPLDG